MSKLSGIPDYTSNQELNAELTMLHLGLQGWEYNWTNKLFFHCGADGSGYYSEPVVDYCGDWDQLMTLVVTTMENSVDPIKSLEIIDCQNNSGGFASTLNCRYIGKSDSYQRAIVISLIEYFKSELYGN